MSGETTAPQIFDRKLLRQKRDRAAHSIHQHNFLHEKTAGELIERLAPVILELPNILIWGGHTPILCQKLSARQGTTNIYWADMSGKLLQQHPDIPDTCSQIIADEEYIPFARHSLDAIVSNLTLHSVNDLKGSLIQAKQALKPDRPFVAALFGGETLRDLKNWLMQTEMEKTAGVSPRIFPFTEIREFGDMMQNLGFVQPVIESEIVEIEYRSLTAALKDMRGMGEGNILTQRSNNPIARKIVNTAEKTFTKKSIKICVELFYVIAWSQKTSND